MSEPIPASSTDETGAMSSLTAEEIVQQIATHRISGESLASEDRRRCVQHLGEQGLSATDIAVKLRVSDRTVVRDRAILRAEGAIVPDLRLGDQMMGELQRLVHTTIQQLRRLACDPDVSAHARLRAAEASVRIFQQYLDTAKSMGYCNAAHGRLQYLEHTDPETVRRRQANMQHTLEGVMGRGDRSAAPRDRR